MKYEEAITILEKPDLDLEEFELSEEFNVLNFTTRIGSLHQDLAIAGVQINIDGDVTSIVIRNKDDIALRVLYSIRPCLTSSERYATVLVTNEKHKRWVRENLLPNTRIKLRVKFAKDNTYEMVDFISNELEMKFGWYQCSDKNCSYKYGRNPDSKKKKCCICGHRIKHVTNLYNEV